MARRKKLNIPEEQFFASLALVFGKPSRAAYSYVSHTMHAYNGYPAGGLAFWLKETDEGQFFTQCVANAGEAKTRAHRMFNKYHRWHLNQETKREKAQQTQHRQEVQATSQVPSDQLPRGPAAPNQ